MRYIIFLFTLFININKIQCQSSLDTIVLFQNAELKFFFSENLFFSENDFKKLFSEKNNDTTFKLIKSKGIKDMVFFELNFEKIEKNKFILYGGTVLYCYDIITNQIFILNDHNVENIKQFTRILKLRVSLLNLKNARTFSESISIEKINSKKLYYAIMKKKSFSFTEIEYYKIN